MKQVLLVGLGGFLGSIGRYKLGGVFLRYASDTHFPLSTFLINVIGCLAIGMLAGLAETRDYFFSDTRLFLITGLLGGFTTFSAFGYEGLYLLRRGEVGTAACYAGLSVLIGWSAVWLGFRLCSLGAR